MKMSKKILKILMIFTLVLTFIFVNIRTKVNAYTLNIEEDEQELFIEETIKIFGNVEINSIEYLYNFNDSPDYVYVDFEGLGYVIYYRTTLEMMEYSYEFDLDYSNIDSRKYYAGPSNYYGKKNNKFIDVDTGDYLNLSDSDIELYANNLTSFFSVDADERLNYFLNLNVDIDNSSITTSQNNNAPEFDKKNFITPNAPGAVNTKYINNYDYFLSNPLHGFNEHGTCGSVAAQILLGYNNYYNDRRIIDVEHLYGDWIGSASSNLYDKSNYVYPERNMNVCNNPMSLTRYTTGTNNDFYEFVIRNIEPTAFNCTCTRTSIVVSGSTATVTTTIYFPDGTTSTSVTTRDATPGEQTSENIEHTHTGSSTDDVVEGLGNILSAKFDESQYSITHDEKGWFFGWSPISSTPIKAEIDSGRPLIIGLDSDLGGTDHWVVGYGYQDYNYPGDSETYSGYIVHFGWPNRYNVWINESWCDSYIALQMNHTHNLNIQTNNIIDDTKIELRCGECGYRTLDDLYTVSDNTLVSVNYEISGDIEIPENINGTQILSIGNNAFSNQNNLLSVTIPNTITNIDTSAFEGCSYLQSVTLSTNLIAIGSSAFKGCASLESISIPNSVTHIDTSAFEGCSYLQSVTLSNNLIAIGSSAFKGCASLARITIPNTVTNIDTSAFEGCSYLQSVTLSTNLIAIGSSAFKGCGSLERIVIPLSVQYIDDEAFKNCSSLSVVTVNRRITNITNLGVSVFDGCNASLKIIVPVNRIAEYKNKEYWSSYRNKITPSEDYAELEIDCEGNVSESLSLSKATNELYKLNVNCSKSYKINANSSNNVNIIIYDSNMNVISSGSNTLTQFLGCGIYYISFEFDDTNASGTFEIGISLTWTSSNILLNKGTNNIKNSMHLNNGNAYHCSYEYFNNQGEGFYRFSLNIGSNEILPEGTIKIYSNINKTELLNRYGSTGINEQAITYNGENELYVFLPENGYYYIDVVLPKSTYSLITLTIEQVEKNNINYQNRLATIGFDELFDNKTVTNYFEEVTISHRSKIELDIVTSGTINRNIPIYIFEKHRDPGYEPGDNHYYLVLEYTNNITSINSGPVFTVILNPGTYYIGYSDNFDKVQIQFALRRKVNTDLNIDGTLVTDPARNQGFPLGSEVTFNNGSLLGNTITEGFTRNLYLMVEDRLRDPMSRLDYDWYSSNENVAKVTKYGTVLALNVSENTTVTIYAINKDDPSIVYKKDFIILKETKTEQIVIECNMSYSYSEENGMYTLELDFTNSPYPYIGYYVWDIECFNGINVDMEHHGLVSSTGPGEALLTANYTLNMRIFLKIHLTITE